MNSIIALVAGASRGAGKGIALALAEIGATVYVVGRSSRMDGPNPLGTIEETAEAVDKLGGKGIAVKCDCSRKKDLEALFHQIEQTHQRLDILVNAAWGGNEAPVFEGDVFEMVELNWEYMFERGVRNYLLTSCLAVPLLKKSRQALIANISFWDDDKYIGHLYYDLSKNAMNRMALGLHHELSKDQVAVVSLSPGYMKTERVLDVLDNDPSLAEKFGIPSESTRYVGRAVTAIYQDVNKLKKSGQCFRVGDLAREYNFTDVDGTQPEPFLVP